MKSFFILLFLISLIVCNPIESKEDEKRKKRDKSFKEMADCIYNDSISEQLKNKIKTLEKNDEIGKILYIDIINNFESKDHKIIKKCRGEYLSKMIKLNIHLEKLIENLDLQQPVDILKLNSKLKINGKHENIEITDDLINELIITKKREIYRDFPQCCFYPAFIKDIKLNILLLLTNNIIFDQIFNKDFTDFYVTSFNEKSNRFFAILCLA
jgi:hypothetical protein